MEEILQKVALYLGIGVGGLTVGGIIVGIVWAFVRGYAKRTGEKLNVKQVVKETISETVGQVKKIAMTHSIQPLVASELEKVNEKQDERLTKAIEKLNNKFDKVINIQEKFYDYFEDSMVSDEKKKAMKEAIEDAKEQYVEVKSVIVEESPKVEEKAIVAPVEAVKTQVKVER